jgi:hypothetical protein
MSLVDTIKTAVGLDNRTNVKSTVDNSHYKVRDLPDKHVAADRIAEIRRRLQILKTHFENPKFADDGRV